MLERAVNRWFALGLGVLMLWVARDVLPPFIVAGIGAYVLAPFVNSQAERFNVNRRWVAIATFVVIVLLLAVFVVVLGQRLSSEIQALRREGPSIVDSVTEHLTGGRTIVVLGQSIAPEEVARRIQQVSDQQLNSPAGAITAARYAIGGLLNIFLTLLALLYLLMDGQRLGAFVLRFVPVDHRAHTQEVAQEIHHVLGRYLQGQALLVVLVSTATFAVLEWVFHLPYALWIAILTGVLELVPLVGPVVAAVIACGVGLSQGGPVEAGWLALTYLVIRQVEDQLMMPIVVGHAVEVHPLVTIFAVLTGERVAGVLGMIVAVPVAAAIKVILDYAYPASAPVPEETAPAGSAAPELAGGQPRAVGQGAQFRPHDAGVDAL